MFNSLLALRQACCHPCIGSGGIETSAGGSRLGGGLAGGAGNSSGRGAGAGGQGRWLSMDQILDRWVVHVARVAGHWWTMCPLSPRCCSKA